MMAVTLFGMASAGGVRHRAERDRPPRNCAHAGATNTRPARPHPVGDGGEEAALREHRPRTHVVQEEAARAVPAIIFRRFDSILFGLYQP